MTQNEKEQNDYRITYYNAVSSKEVDWLWYPYIPYGKITILQGDPGEGKSTMMMQLAALITTGKAMPDGSGDKIPGNVIYQAAEDGIEDTIKYRFRGQYSKEDNEQILLFDLEEPEVIKHEIIQEDLPDTDTTETEENTVDTSKNKTKKIVRTLFPKQWQNHFGDSSEDVLLLHRVKYYGNWDVLRPAKIVEGLEPISENLLDKLNEEAQNMIEKMRCAV